MRIHHTIVAGIAGAVLLSVPGMALAQAGTAPADVAAPTTILVDKHGVVRALFRPTNIGSRLSAREVLAMVDKELAVQ